MFKNQGRSVQGSGGDDDHIIRGSNLRLTNLQAAVGLSQLKKIKKRAEILKSHYLYYKSNLNKKIKLFDFRDEELPLWTDAYFLERDKLLGNLYKKNIDCRKFWRPMSEQKSYTSKVKIDLYYRNLFWLPSSFNLNISKKKYICKSINEYCLK